MKLALGLLMIASISTFAGPEERQYNNCFHTTAEVPAGISSVICYEGLSLDLNKNEVTPGVSVYVPSKLKTDKLIRQTEDTYSFSASAVIMDKEESVCGPLHHAEIVISGKADFLGNVDENTVKLSVEYDYLRDWCHSSPNSTTITYKRLK